jgi:NADPH:quinone reductase-like Zn-dependent oxidoreductase
MGLVGGGGQAEAVVVRAEEVLPLPPNLSYVEGAAIPEVFYTAYDALVNRGRVAAGERVLIHAVGSGVGTAAAQIAKYLGATVIGTSRSAGKLARAAAYGVDVGIDTSRTAFGSAVGVPVHVVLDVLGASALADNLSVLAVRGRLVMLGLMAGRRTDMDLEPVLHKRLEIIGSVLR